MEKIDNTIRYTRLFGLYGELLTYSQKIVVENYYCLDLSISEIADLLNISRSAVEDALSKGKQKLDEFEDKIQLYAKTEQVLKICGKLKEKALNCSEIQEIEEIEKELDYGI